MYAVNMARCYRVFFQNVLPGEMFLTADDPQFGITLSKNLSSGPNSSKQKNVWHIYFLGNSSTKATDIDIVIVLLLQLTPNSSLNLYVVFLLGHYKNVIVGFPRCVMAQLGL